MSKRVAPVVLERRWNVSSLLGETFRLFFKHAALFVPVTAIVAIPYVVAMDLAIGDRRDDGIEVGATLVPVLLGSTVVPALITSLHAVALVRLAQGQRLSVGETFALTLERVLPVIGAALLYLLAVAVGLALLIVPGIWVAVRLYFGAQAAVIERLEPTDALIRSADLVKNRWWVTAGRFLLAGICFALATIPLTVPLGFVDYGATYVVLDCLVETVVLSLTALFGTLVFFDYRGPAYGGFEPPQALAGS